MDNGKKKAGLILEKLDAVMSAFDDMSAAIDEFHIRIKALEDRKADEDLGRRLEDIESRLRDIDYTLDNVLANSCPDNSDELTELKEEILTVSYQLDELAYERASAERRQMLLEARAAMGKVKFVTMLA